jgi:hypothetical protein
MQTNIDQATGLIVKSDQTGRTRYTPQYKREVLDAFQSSCLSAPAFAQQCGIKYSTLAAWIGAGKRADRSSSRRDTPAFLVAEVASSAGGSALEVQLPSGAIVRASNAEQIRLLAALLRHLA